MQNEFEQWKQRAEELEVPGDGTGWALRAMGLERIKRIERELHQGDKAALIEANAELALILAAVQWEANR
jgi:hypothetical protein